MNLRGVWGNAVKSIGVAALSCGVLFLTFHVGAGKRGFGSGGGNRGLTAKASPASKPATAQQTQRWAAAYGRLPMSFEENQGQTAREVRYVTHGGGYELFLTQREAVLALRAKTHLDFSPRHRAAYIRALRELRRTGKTTPLTAIRMQFEGANPDPQVTGVDLLPTRVNYFTGSDPKNWRSIPSYARVKYAEIYPGVDLVFYGNQRRLEYDFVVAPGADPRAIQLKIDGAKKMRVNAHGDLLLSVADGEVVLQKPLVYQQVSGDKREIAGKFVVAGNHRVTFSLGKYDRRAPLILDPVLNYSTYLGGSGDENITLPNGIAMDSAGDAFVAGQTFSTDFPTTLTGIGGNANPNPNAAASFVAELNPAGDQLLFSAYLVGVDATTGFDGATSVAVDSTGKVYVTGVTGAAGFPSKNALPYSANTTSGTCFVTKLDPTQTVPANALLFSTYLGGTTGLGDFANGIAVDASGNAYIAGETSSTDFPVVNAYQATFNAANTGNASGSAFLSRIDTTTSTLVYSTYLSGNVANIATNTQGFGDIAYGVAVDANKNAYIVGATSSTNSTNFPSSTTANEPAPPAANTNGSAFVTKINTAGSGATSLAYSTYLAGSAEGTGFGIALGPNNLAYVTGETNSNDFPTTTGAYDTSGASAGKAFITVVDTTNAVVGSPFFYSTLLGGGGGDTGFGIKVDGSGNAYVVGTAASPNFPLTPGPLQSARLNGFGDVFVAKLSPGGNGSSDLLYSTFFGGSGNPGAPEPLPDQGYAIAIDSANPPNVYITGETQSADLPILSPLPGGGTLNGISDAYVAKLTLIPTLTVAPFPSFDFGTQPIGVATSAQTFTVTNNTASLATFSSIKTTGANSADFAITSDACSPAGVGAGLTCNIAVTFTPSVAALESATLVITAVVTNGGQQSTDMFNVTLTGTGSASAPAVGLSTNMLTFNPQMVTTTSAAMPVTLTNTGTGPLAINSIAASGDFAATSTGATACPISPNTLPATAGSNTCTINVTFTPTATGARNGNLTITDNANGSPHTVTLNGTGWDFTVTAATPQSGKSPLVFNATLTSLGGFNQTVAFTCTGAPTGATCTVASPVTGNPNTPQSVQVTITRTGSGLVAPPAPMRLPPMSIWQITLLLMALMLLFLLPRASRLRVRLGMIAAMVLLLTVAGCSGPKPPVQPLSGNVTITGQSTGTAGSVSHSAQVAITVN